MLLSSSTPSGITQTGGACILSGKSANNPTPTCTLTLNINGRALPSDNISGGPILCQTNSDGSPSLTQCYQPSPNDVLVITRTDATTLRASVSELALSVTGLIEYGVNGTPPSGLARVITITNTGSNTAVHLAVTPPTWPAGTSSTTDCGDTLAASSSCTITITPGATASSDGSNPCSSGTAPDPGPVQVSANNATTVSINVVVLSYGCIYQGGHVYALDDTTSINRSVDGKVVTTRDQATSIIWSSNGNGSASTDVAYNAIYGISQNSTTSFPDPDGDPLPGQTACDGATNGSCNTHNIMLFYTSIDPLYYAAGLCKQKIDGYDDWYLPAICEMGYDLTGFGSGCGSSSEPKTQNIQQSLIEKSGLSTLLGNYWSSSELSGNSSACFAWANYFAPLSSGDNNQFYFYKNSQLGVRCSRALTF